MKYKLTSLILALFMFGCMQDTKKGKEASTAETEKKVDVSQGYFTLELNAIVELDDTITMFYLDVDDENISMKNSIPVEVKGSPDVMQTLTFKLKDNTLPIRLVIKLGKEKKAQRITFFDSKMTYHNTKIDIPRTMFYQYFNPNQFIEYNKADFSAITKEVNKEYKPTFYSRKTLEDKIDMTLF